MRLINYLSDNSLGMDTKNVGFDFASWNVRFAGRSVIVNQENQIALMYIGKYDVYKLPGGGIDDNEALETGVRREILEETGCVVSDMLKLGIVIEQRNRWKLFQISDCYLSKVEVMGKPTLTVEEKKTGFSLFWAKDVNEAQRLINLNSSSRYDDKYIKARETSIIEAAKGLLLSKSGITSYS